MDSKIYDELKKIFGSSCFSDELFDAFNYTIKNRIYSLELYQLLLWNKSISKDEVLLYAFKICSVYPAIAYDINILVAGIFEACSGCGDDYMTALFYYKKAISIKPEDAKAYVAAAGLYHNDLKIPPFDILVNLLTEGLEKVTEKSVLYYALAALYNKSGNSNLMRKFREMGDAAAVKE